MKIKFLMGILLSAGISSSCYATINDEEFFNNEKTVLTLEQYEENGKLMVRITGKQGDTEEYMNKEMTKNLTGWLNYDRSFPPFSTPIYQVSVSINSQEYACFDDYYGSEKTFHTLKSELPYEDKAAIGEWGNMYKINTYVRPDNSEHNIETIVGQYMIEQSEELVEARRKFWDGTSFEKIAWKGFNTHVQVRYNNFKADVHELIEKRFEKYSENENKKLISETKEEVLKNKCERGDEPDKAPHTASWN